MATLPDSQLIVFARDDDYFFRVLHSRPHARAHGQLDLVVYAAYGWPYRLSDEDILERLIALNLSRSEGLGAVASRSE